MSLLIKMVFNMKKYIILAAVALVASAACSKVEVRNEVPDLKVTFQAANYVPQTKADGDAQQTPVSYLNEFKAGEKPYFTAKAYMKGSQVDGYQAFFGANGEKVYAYASATATGEANALVIPDSGTPTVNHWAPSRDYYWPKFEDSYINFLFWYDSNAQLGPTTPSVADVSGENAKPWTMEWKDRPIGTGDNIIYADPAWHFKQNLTGDAAMYKLNGVTEGVPVLFHHALAQIEFRVYVEPAANMPALSVDGNNVKDDVATWTIKLANPELMIYNQGTLSLIAEEATTLNTKGTWKWNRPEGVTVGSVDVPEWVPTEGATANNILNTYTTNGFPVKAIALTGDGSDGLYLLKNQSVLPQHLDNVSLKFDLDIVSAYGNNSNHEILSIEIPMGAGTTAKPGFATPGTEWKLNTKYIYTIKIIPSQNKVLFDPAVEKAWDTYEKELTY